MAKRKHNNFSTIITSVVILLLSLLFVGYLFVYSDNFTTPLKNFYVSVGNDDFISDRANYTIIKGEEIKFNITTNINISGKDTKYIVSVVPNVTEDTYFKFLVGSEEVEFGSIESLSKGFDISCYEDYFILKANLDLPEILSLYYQDEIIADVPTTIDTNKPYFKLVISSVDNTETININFNIKSEKL